MWFCLPQNIKIVVDAIHVNMSNNVTLALLQRMASVRAKSFKVARQPNPHSMNICPRHQATRQNIRQALYPPAPTSLHLQQNGPPPPPYPSTFLSISVTQRSKMIATLITLACLSHHLHRHLSFGGWSIFLASLGTLLMDADAQSNRFWGEAQLGEGESFR